jgi:hypothetical protein
MTNDENFDPQHSMQIINTMINRAQNRFSENGFLFIFWGWLVFVTALAFYALLQNGVENAWLAWYTMPFGGVFTMIYSIRQKKKEKVKSYIDDYMAYVGIAFGAALVITLTFGFKLQLACYPMVIMLYAIMTFVTGGILRFRPLIIGGALSFPISAVALFFPFTDQVLFLSLSVLVSYIIPGHWLMIKHKQHHSNV